jgi:5,10-methylenetetrahydromethanopterin reductase
VVRTLLREGEVSHHGETIDIERFDLWFTPARPDMPVYLAALFPKMLELCGEIGDGVVLTGSTLETAGRVSEHIAAGARRANRDPGEIDVTSLLPCSVADDRGEAIDALRPGVAQTAGFYPRYRRVLAESGFQDVAKAIGEAWRRGDRDAAVAAVTDEVVLSRSVAGAAAECRERLDAYREAGLGLPIISPARGSGGLQGAMDALRACAP